jgi:small-conductance mechanosensitive channel
LHAYLSFRRRGALCRPSEPIADNNISPHIYIYIILLSLPIYIYIYYRLYCCTRCRYYVCMYVSLILPSPLFASRAHAHQGTISPFSHTLSLSNYSLFLLLLLFLMMMMMMIMMMIINNPTHIHHKGKISPFRSLRSPSLSLSLFSISSLSLLFSLSPLSLSPSLLFLSCLSLSLSLSFSLLSLSSLSPLSPSLA